MRSHICPRVAGALLFLAASLPAYASVYFVNANARQAPFDGSSFAHGFRTIQDGINYAITHAANRYAEVRIAEGIYIETDSIAASDVLVNLEGGYAGTDADTRDPTAYPTLLDANFAGSALNMNLQLVGEAELDGLTIINGSGTSVNGAMRGGAVLATGGILTVDNCIFRNNSVVGDQASGGAIDVEDGTLSISGCQFHDNTAPYGGAMALEGTGSAGINNCTFKDNGSAARRNDGTPAGKTDRGGAVYITPDAAARIHFTQFQSNMAGAGGAVCDFSKQDQDVAFNTFQNNQAPGGSGGAVCLWRAAGNGKLTNVDGNIFDANTADGLGAAVYVYEPDGDFNAIADNVFTGNISTNLAAANGQDGVIVAEGAAVVNNTMTANPGKALSLFGPCLVANNIIAFNGAGVSVDALAAGSPFHANDVYANRNAAYTGVADPTGTDGNVAADPLFEGRQSGDLHLTYDSPCRNTGNDQDAIAYAGQKDMDDEYRFAGDVDIGADEFYPYLAFDAFPDPTFANEPFAPQPSITVKDREGHRLTSVAGTVTLSLTGSLVGVPLTGDATEPVVNGTVTYHNVAAAHAAPNGTLTAVSSFASLAGAGPVPVYLHRAFASPAGDDSHYGDSWDQAVKTLPAAVALVKGPDAQVWAAAGTYSGPLTVPNGVTLSGSFDGVQTAPAQRNPLAHSSIIQSSGPGAAVRFPPGPADGDSGIDGFTITGGQGNTAIGPQGHYTEGGGVDIQQASPVVSHNLITGNHADVGGGISVHGGSPVVSGNLITHNASAGIVGMAGAGGIAIWPASFPAIMDNVIAYNTGANGGAGALSVASNADIHNNTMVGNYSDPGQGDVVISGGSPAFTNNIIANEASIEQTGGTPSFNYNDYRPATPSSQPFQIPAGSVGNVAYYTIFVNAPHDDFHLSNPNILMDTGTLGAVLPRETDMDGEPRVMGKGVDIGADEVFVRDTIDDVERALSIAGGMAAATRADVLRYDWLDPVGVGLDDAERLAIRALAP